MRRNPLVESIPHGEPGFTLMEMLIVVSVLVVMAGMVVVLLNPVENLKKARDAQRVTDLKTIHNAVTTYLGIQDTTYLAGTASSDGCKGSTGYVSGDKIYYS